MTGPLRTVTGADLPALGWASRTPLDPDQIGPCELWASLPAKPHGGLWTSPLDPDRRTTPWTRHRPEGLSHPPTRLTVLHAHHTARVLLIDIDDDATALDARYGWGDRAVPPRDQPWKQQIPADAWAQLHTQRRIDWQRLATDFDAVHLTADGLNTGGGTIPRLDWDVPSVWFTRPAFTATGVSALPRRRPPSRGH